MGILQAEELLRGLPIALAVRSGDVVTCNAAAARLTGAPAGVPVPSEQWFAASFGARPDGERSVVRLRRADDAPCWVECTVQVFGPGQEVWALYDITERYLSEERLRTLFERSTDAHLLFDGSGIFDCNQAAVDLLRCADRQELLATHPAVFSPELQPDGRSSAEKSVEMDAIARREGYHRFDWVHRKRDGVDFPVEVTLNPVTLRSGPALLVVWHDLTARREAERALLEARDRALEAARAKSQFLATMSHELRTPLNAIIGYTDLLLEGAIAATSPMVFDLRRIRASGLHLLALINDILDLSHIEAGQLALRPEWVELDALVRSVAETVSGVARRHGNTVSIEVDPTAPRIHHDAARTRQVLLNLFGNAAKFTRNGRIGVRVRVATAGWVRCEVHDTGPGIADHLRDHLFEAFTQADSSNTRQHGGTGLGLSISWHLVEKMGGRITLDTQVGRGTTFTVDLPVDGP